MTEFPEGMIEAAAKRISFAAVLVLCFSAFNVQAMVPMDESAMSDVVGQDGILVDIGLDSTIARVEVRSDVATANQASVFMDDIAISAIGGGPADVSVSLDVGGNGTTGFPLLRAEWTDLDLRIGSIARTAGGNSFGEFAIRGTGSLTMGNEGGLFNTASTNGIFDLTSNGDIIMRQGPAGSPELSFGNLNLGARFTDGAGNSGFGTFGIDNDGILISAPFADFDLNFDLLFKANPTDFDLTGRQAMILFGWKGGIRDATIRVGSGGIGTNTTSATPDGLARIDVDGSLTGSRTDGINILAEWNYDTDFSWIIGQAANTPTGDETKIRFFDWQRFAGAPIDFSMPIIIDAINAGQGPGGICFGGALPTFGSLTSVACTSTAVGGSFEEIVAKNDTLAVVIRDGRLHAFNNQIEVQDPTGTIPSEIFNWSLLYTFGKLDSNIFLRANATGGIRSDVVLAIQSPGYWEAAQDNFASVGLDDPRDRWATNTHFLIADTGTAVNIPTDPLNLASPTSNKFGIGLVNADLLWRVEDLDITLQDGSGATPAGIQLKTDTFAQYQFRGLFGGGSLDDLSNPVRLALVDINLETDAFSFLLSPAPVGESFLGFGATFDFNGNAFVSLAEPSAAQADFSVADISGRLAWENGKIEVKSANNDPTNRPSLNIENDILLGSTAAGGAPFIGTIRFGGEALGRVAVPSGQWYSNVILRKQ